MRVYHGSYVKIERIDLTLCQPNRDFGRGFYVTKFREQAESWAERKGNRKKTVGIVSGFDFADTALAEHFCRIKRFDGYNGEWLDFVVSNRNNKSRHPVHDCDIVEGPVADDKIQNRIYDYLSGAVSKAHFLKELIYSEESHQICFCTLASLQFIRRIENVSVSKFVRIGEPLIEQLMLDSQIDALKAADLLYASETFARLEDEETLLHLKSWREIYDMLKRELNIN